MDTGLSRIIRVSLRDEVALGYAIPGPRAGREEIGTYVSRARTALCPYPEKEGREKEGREPTGTRSIYPLWTLARSPARICRWARRWRRARWDGRTPSRFPFCGGGPHVWCVYTPCRRAGRPGRLLGGRRFNAEHKYAERSTKDRSNRLRVVDRWAIDRRTRDLIAHHKGGSSDCGCERKIDIK